MTPDTIFTIAGKGSKLNTAEDVQEYVNSILEFKNLEEVVLSGNTFGVEAAQAIAMALKKKDSLKIVNASDTFTGRLREEIPHSVKAICDALEDKECLVELSFSDNAFGPAGAEPMVDFLTNNKSLKILKLNNVGLGPRGGKLIGKALLAAAEKHNAEGRKSSFTTIIAGRNRLENESSQAIANAIAAHGTLVEIRMPQNGIRPEGIITLCKGLAACKNLEILDLQDNTFTAKGARAFAEALVKWPNLKYLNIGDCLLSAKGGVVIAEALLLGHNKKLESLNLQYNEINCKGVKALSSAILTHLKDLVSLELNGNNVEPDDASIKELISALEAHGHADALGELDDMEILDDEDEDESEKDDDDELEKDDDDEPEKEEDLIEEPEKEEDLIEKPSLERLKLEDKDSDIEDIEAPTGTKPQEVEEPLPETKSTNDQVEALSERFAKAGHYERSDFSSKIISQ
ncbi:RNI-like protein [Gigaspora margarita]|uniref:RNI-like protein n=1 Tax=Gigaspora margarita TaxID=4874 RepID=A0A8H3X610_GIGMA|nr:RNI-like protein [Gigaspora margarita]